MTTIKDHFTRWSRSSTKEKDHTMNTEQLEDSPPEQQDHTPHADLEAGTEGRNTLHDAGHDGASDEAEPAAQHGSLEQLRGERDLLAQQLVQVQDRLARLQAEFDNARKREAKERQDTRDHATQAAIEPFLGVMDNFALALKSEGDLTQLRAGVALILKQMEEALRSLNVAAVATIGEPFDPRIHEALGSIETVEHPDHQVLEEIRRGYKLRDKLLRPALVRIASNTAQVSE